MLPVIRHYEFALRILLVHIKSVSSLRLQALLVDHLGALRVALFNILNLRCLSFRALSAQSLDITNLLCEPVQILLLPFDVAKEIFCDI